MCEEDEILQDELKLEGKASIYGNWEMPVNVFLPKNSVWEHDGQLTFLNSARIDGDLHVTGPLVFGGNLSLKGTIVCDSSVTCNGEMYGDGEIICQRLFNFGPNHSNINVSEEAILSTGKHVKAKRR